MFQYADRKVRRTAWHVESVYAMAPASRYCFKEGVFAITVIVVPICDDWTRVEISHFNTAI